MTLSGISSILILFIGLVYSIMAFNIPQASIGNPLGPKYYPIMLGVLMTIFGIMLVAQSYKKGEFKEEKKEKKEEKGMIYQTKLIIYTCVVSIIYALIFNKAGYVISTTFFLGAILFVVNGKEKWKLNIIVATCFSFVVYFAFNKMMGIMLPMMPFIYW